MRLLSEFQLIGVVIGAISGTIIIYQFLIHRPDLKVTLGIEEEESKFIDNSITEDEVIASISFYISNIGRTFAEDCYVRVGLDGWFSGWEGDSKFDGSILDIDKKNKTLTSNGEIHQIFINNVLYPGTNFQLFAERAKFQIGETYRIEYLVACRSYKSTTGELIILWVDATHPTRGNRLKQDFSNVYRYTTNIR